MGGHSGQLVRLSRRGTFLTRAPQDSGERRATTPDSDDSLASMGLRCLAPIDVG